MSIYPYTLTGRLALGALITNLSSHVQFNADDTMCHNVFEFTHYQGSEYVFHYTSVFDRNQKARYKVRYNDIVQQNG